MAKAKKHAAEPKTNAAEPKTNASRPGKPPKAADGGSGAKAANSSSRPKVLTDGKLPLPPGDLRMRPPKSGVTVRMYRVGLGDCFLLCFPRKKAKGAGSAPARPVFVLIDCGVYLQTPDGADRVNLIARHIYAATNDKADGSGTSRLDLLVVTHEHWDHLSGFHDSQAQQVFGDEHFKVDRVWLPWTEDPKDDLALQLRHLKVSTAKALALAYAAMLDRGAATEAPGQRVETTLNMLGFARDSGSLSAAARAGFDKDDRTGKALKWIKEHFEPAVRFRKPGPDPKNDDTLAGLDGVRFYVLGPPHDEVLIRRLDPRMKDDEAYGKTKALAAAVSSAFFAAFGAMPGEQLPAQAAQGDDDARLADERRRRSRPFEDLYRIEAGSEESKPDSAFRTTYFDRDQDWRRIDTDWLDAAGQFALNVDGLANNSSLALAIELSPGGRVLLFPGDAQIGNWLSWFGKVPYPNKEFRGQDMVWTLKDGKTVDAKELLARTVLYKVGHHGSHNATLKHGGFELMASKWPDEFVAMLPVNENLARYHTSYGEMPLTSLVYALLDRTKGRLFRTDEGEAPERSSKHPEFIPTVNGVHLRSKLEDTPDLQPLKPDKFPNRKDDPSKYGLYFDYTIHGE